MSNSLSPKLGGNPSQAVVAHLMDSPNKSMALGKVGVCRKMPLLLHPEYRHRVVSPGSPTFHEVLYAASKRISF